MFLLGLFSGSEVLVFAVAHDMIEDKLAGTAVSLTNMIVMISGIMQYLVGLSLEYFANPFPQETLVKTYTEQDFQISFLIMPIGLILAFILSFLLNETYHLKDNEE